MKLKRVALLLSALLIINLIFVPTAWAQLPGPLEDMLREAEAALSTTTFFGAINSEL